jgi:hypothetical protein
MKRILISVLVMLMLTLAACGAASSGTGQTASTPPDGALPIQMQILIGTFKLDGTDQAVTSQQAAELLPLWQVYKDLSSSDTAAQEEIDGLVQQIQDTMTPDQMRAITDMNLTRQDMFTVMQDQGITQGRGQGSQNGNGSNFTPPEGFVPPDGGPPGGFGGGEPGGFPGGGGNRQGGQNFTPEQIATAQAARGQGGGFNRLPPGLIDALIQYLEKQAGS